ncbi:MAG: PaaI family thioesterase [Alphaproteobacteria bacterium]|nr:PaaI family thioesterase [Alphaproteobacteria bacterium]MCB9928343.1 PaaI family thioesterase [Alphaproteobacteria bacterium]
MSPIPADFPAAYRISDPIDPHEIATGPFYEPLEAAGDPRVVLLVEEKHCNSAGTTHGGLLMTMADLTLCAAAREGLPGERAITVQLDAQFIASGAIGDFLVARGEVVRRGGKLIFVRGQITCGERVLLTASAVTRRVKRNPAS